MSALVGASNTGIMPYSMELVIQVHTRRKSESLHCAPPSFFNMFSLDLTEPSLHTLGRACQNLIELIRLTWINFVLLQHCSGSCAPL